MKLPRSLFHVNRYMKEYRDVEFKDVCKLTGGEYEENGPVQKCYYERGPQSGMLVTLDTSDYTLSVYDISIKPFSSTRKETFTESVNAVKLPGKPKFHCVGEATDTFYAPDPSKYQRSSVMMACFATFGENKDPFKQEDVKFDIYSYVGSNSYVRVLYQDLKSRKVMLDIRRRLNKKESPVVYRLIKISEEFEPSPFNALP